MAKYGAMDLNFCPFAEVDAEEGAGLPDYDATKRVNLGALQKFTDSYSDEEVRMDGDDVLQEYLDEITEGAADVESCQLTQPAERILFGLGSGDDLELGTQTTPPWGGLTFVRSIMYHGTRYYQGIYFPKAKAKLQGEEDETKGKSMSFRGDKLHFVIAPAKNGTIKVKSAWKTTVDAAKSWCTAKFPGAAASETPATPTT